MNEMTSCGRDPWPAVTMVIFRNYQWGAEKRNTTLWYDDNFVGTELNLDVQYAKIAEACGLKGVQVTTMDQLTEALRSEEHTSELQSLMRISYAVFCLKKKNNKNKKGKTHICQHLKRTQTSDTYLQE